MLNISILRYKIARDIANWNFMTSELWPHFLGRVQGNRHYFDIFELGPSRATNSPKISFLAPWADFVTHIWSYMCTQARVHHHIKRKRILACRLKSYNKEQWMVCVTEVDHVNHGRTTSGNGQASRSRHCCASQTTQVDGQPSQQMCLLE